jgi:flavin-dependent dehydrogenase
MPDRPDPDAIVIGGGPAGAAAATALAMAGRRVLLLEKERFPRYSIGESMMPYCYFPLERIGFIETMKASRFVKKYSVQFVSRDGRASQPFYFSDFLDHEASTTWQVLRSEFDQMLLDHARARGVEVREATEVRELLRDGGGGGRVVGVRAAAGAWHAPITIDASGRRALASVGHRWRRMEPGLKKVALWTYYRGAARDAGRDEGATTVAYVEGKNWFWYIPLHDDVVSVGVVGDDSYLYRDTRDPEAVFDRQVARNAWIRDHLAPGRRIGEFRTCADFSYRSFHCASDGLVLAGDAFAFLDPIFSSGLFLALHSGVLAGDAAAAALAAGDTSAARFEEYGRRVCRATEAIRQLVYAFYDPEFSFRACIDRHPDTKAEITHCLVGNLERDFSRLFTAVADLARLPAPLAYGLPSPGR